MEVYLAALALLAIAPLIRAWIWRVPPSLLGFPIIFRTALGASLVTLAVGLATQLVLGVAGSQPALAARVGAGTGAALSLLFVFASSQRSRTLRATLHLCRFLAQPSRRDPAWRALTRLLDDTQPRGLEPIENYAQLILMATGPMTLAGYWTETLQRLDSLAITALEPGTVALRAQAMATCSLQLGRLETAREALDSVGAGVEDDATRRWLEVTEALLLVVMGNVEEALERLDDEAAEEDAALAASHRVIRAHAAACRGDDEQARIELERLRAEAGPLSLERALAPVGPATDIARRVLMGEDEAPSVEPQSG